jgi:hypothetical protein
MHCLLDSRRLPCFFGNETGLPKFPRPQTKFADRGYVQEILRAKTVEDIRALCCGTKSHRAVGLGTVRKSAISPKSPISPRINPARFFNSLQAGLRGLWVLTAYLSQGNAAQSLISAGSSSARLAASLSAISVNHSLNVRTSLGSSRRRRSGVPSSNESALGVAAEAVNGATDCADRRTNTSASMTVAAIARTQMTRKPGLIVVSLWQKTSGIIQIDVALQQ